MQQQPPQGCGQTPPSPPPPPLPSDRTRKRQRTVEQTPTGPSDALTRTPPQPSRGIIIQELSTQAGTKVVSSSRAALAWQPTYQLDSKPLSATARVRVWEKDEGECVTQSLVHGLLLPEDVRAFEEGTEESMGRRL